MGKFASKMIGWCVQIKPFSPKTINTGFITFIHSTYFDNALLHIMRFLFLIFKETIAKYFIHNLYCSFPLNMWK